MVGKIDIAARPAPRCPCLPGGNPSTTARLPDRLNYAGGVSPPAGGVGALAAGAGGGAGGGGLRAGAGFFAGAAGPRAFASAFRRFMRCLCCLRLRMISRMCLLFERAIQFSLAASSPGGAASRRIASRLVPQAPPG